MDLRKIIKNTLNILLPLALGSGILYWMYRGFDFERVSHALTEETNWWWMSFSLVFGVTAQLFRGLRWRQSLEPLGEYPSTMNCIHAIFISYTTSLIIPRSGEVTRCGILKRYDGTSFPKAIGTVVAERIIDSLLLLLIAAVVFFTQISTFHDFFKETGTNMSGIISGFSTTGYIVTAICALAVVVLLIFAIKHLTLFATLKKIVNDIKEGIFSLKGVRRKWLFGFYTIGIWVSYFLHFYITFFCFDFTSDLSIMTAVIAFIAGSFAVIVPTPNGMGSWHFAVKTILLLSGVKCAVDAETYVLIVHAIQTALMPVLGMYSAVALLLKTPKKQ